MGESNSVVQFVSEQIMYRHLKKYCSHPLIFFLRLFHDRFEDNLQTLLFWLSTTFMIEKCGNWKYLS